MSAQKRHDFQWALDEANALYPDTEWVLGDIDFGYFWAIGAEKYQAMVILATPGCNYYGPRRNVNEYENKVEWLREAIAQMIQSRTGD